MTAAPADVRAARTRAGVAGPLLAIHLLRRAGDLGPGLRLGRALPQVALVHHHGVVQQLPIDVRGQVLGLDVVARDLLARAIVYRNGHADIFPRLRTTTPPGKNGLWISPRQARG